MTTATIGLGLQGAFLEGVSSISIANNTILGNISGGAANAIGLTAAQVNTLLATSGGTWAQPGTIGSSTPNTGAFTTLAASGVVTLSNTTSASSSTAGAVVIGNGTAATSVAFGAGNAQIGAALTVGTNATFGNTAAGGTAINVNAATGNSAYFLFKINNVAQAQFGGNATHPIFANDQIAATPWTNLTYTSGLVSTGYWTFPGTLAASSSTVGAVVIGNGTAATSVAFGGGKANIGGTLAVAGACTLDTGASGSTFGGTLAVTGTLTLAGGTLLSTSGALTNAAGAVTIAPPTNAPTGTTKWVYMTINNNGANIYALCASA